MSGDSDLRFSETNRDLRSGVRDLHLVRASDERHGEALVERAGARVEPAPFELVDLSTGNEGGAGRRRFVDFRQDTGRMTIELGRIRLPRERLANFEMGDVVTMDQDVTQTIAVLVNGIVVARGDLVTVNGRIAVRITERVADSVAQTRRKAA